MDIDQTHVVQELKPGGIEFLAVTLTQRSEAGCEMVSLNGTVPNLLAGWDALKPVAGQFSAFAKMPGLRPALIISLARHFRANQDALGRDPSYWSTALCGPCRKAGGGAGGCAY